MGEALAPVGGLEHAEAALAQVAGEQVAVGVVVVDDQEQGGRRLRRGRCHGTLPYIAAREPRSSP